MARDTAKPKPARASPRYAAMPPIGGGGHDNYQDIVDSRPRRVCEAVLCQAPDWAAKRIVDALNNEDQAK